MPTDPKPGRWIGLAGMAEAWRLRLSAFEDFRFVVDEYREIDHEQVLAVIRGSGRVKASGLSFEQTTWNPHVFHVVDSKVTKLVVYSDRDRALGDLGWEE